MLARVALDEGGIVGKAIIQNRHLSVGKHADINVVDLAVDLNRDVVAFLAEQGDLGQSVSYLYFHILYS